MIDFYNKLSYIQETKNLIKTSINNKGGNLTTEPFRDYPTAIDNLPSGGSEYNTPATELPNLANDTAQNGVGLLIETQNYVKEPLQIELSTEDETNVDVDWGDGTQETITYSPQIDRRDNAYFGSTIKRFDIGANDYIASAPNYVFKGYGGTAYNISGQFRYIPKQNDNTTVINWGNGSEEFGKDLAVDSTNSNVFIGAMRDSETYTEEGKAFQFDVATGNQLAIVKDEKSLLAGYNYTTSRLSNTSYNIDTIASNGSTIAMGSNDSDVLYFSTDNGTTWSTEDLSSLLSGGNVEKIIYDNSIWILVSDTGGIILKSTTGVALADWSSVNDSGSTVNFNDFKYANGVWLIVGESDTILRSTNNGDNWSLINPGIAAINTLDYDSVNNIWVVAGDYGSTYSIVASNDNGATWTYSTHDTSGDFLNITYITYANGVWLGSTTSQFLMRSYDNALTWDKYDTGISPDDIIVTEYGNGVWLAMTTDNDFLKSMDNGQSWTWLYDLITKEGSTTTSGVTENSIKYINGLWISSARNYLFISEDDANTWRSIALDFFSTTNDVQYVNNRIIIGRDSGYYSVSNVDSIQGSALQEEGFGFSVTYENNALFVGSYNNQKVRYYDNSLGSNTFQTADEDIRPLVQRKKGELWNNGIFTGSGSGSIETGKIEGSTIILAFRDNILRSTDEGETWAEVYTGANDELVEAKIIYTGSTWIISSRNIAPFILRSIDDGVTWSTPTTAPTDGIYDIDVDTVNGRIVASGQNIWLSTDEGDTWSNVQAGTAIIRTVTEGGQNWIASSATSTEAYYSSDGSTWTSSPINNPINSRLLIYNSGTWIGATETDVQRSVDNGVSWTSIPYPTSGAEDLAYGNGVWAISSVDGISVSRDDGLTWEKGPLANDAGKLYYFPTDDLWVGSDGSDGPFISYDNLESLTRAYLVTPTGFLYGAGPIIETTNKLLQPYSTTEQLVSEKSALTEVNFLSREFGDNIYVDSNYIVISDLVLGYVYVYNASTRAYLYHYFMQDVGFGSSINVDGNTLYVGYTGNDSLQNRNFPKIAKYDLTTGNWVESLFQKWAPDATQYFEDTTDFGFGAGGGIKAAVNGTILSSASSKIFRSTDAGASWTEITQESNNINVFGTNGTGDWFAGAENGDIYYSSDDGLTWGNYYYGTISARGIHAVYDDVNGYYIVNEFYFGIAYAAETDITTWTTNTTNLSSTNWYGMDYHNGTTILGGDSGKIARSTDGGVNWTQTQTSGSRIYDVKYGNGVWLAFARFTVYRSTDDGLNWTPISFTNPIRYGDYGNGIWVGHESGYFYSTDDGLTWTRDQTIPFINPQSVQYSSIANKFFIFNDTADDFIIIDGTDPTQYAIKQLEPSEGYTDTTDDTVNEKIFILTSISTVLETQNYSAGIYPVYNNFGKYLDIDSTNDRLLVYSDDQTHYYTLSTYGYVISIDTPINTTYAKEPYIADFTASEFAIGINTTDTNQGEIKTYSDVDGTLVTEDITPTAILEFLTFSHSFEFSTSTIDFENTKFHEITLAPSNATKYITALQNFNPKAYWIVFGDNKILILSAALNENDYIKHIGVKDLDSFSSITSLTGFVYNCDRLVSLDPMRFNSCTSLENCFYANTNSGPNIVELYFPVLENIVSDSIFFQNIDLFKFQGGLNLVVTQGMNSFFDSYTPYEIELDFRSYSTDFNFRFSSGTNKLKKFTALNDENIQSLQGSFNNSVDLAEFPFSTINTDAAAAIFTTETHYFRSVATNLTSNLTADIDNSTYSNAPSSVERFDFSGSTDTVSVNIILVNGVIRQFLAPPNFTGNIDLSNNEMDATAIDETFTSLGSATGQTITVTGNPGAATCDTTIATGKGWTVVTS